MRTVLRATSLALAAAAASPASALNLRPLTPEGSIAVTLGIVAQYNPDPATEFTPIEIVPFDDGTGRLAISTVQGTIRVINGSGQLVTQPLLTKAQSGLVIPQEAGMTGIAFHPDFNHPGAFGYGKLYTITTERRETQAGGLPDSKVDFPFPTEEHQDVIREWNFSTFGNVPGNAANGQFTGTLANSREIFRTDRPGPFHNVADITFNSHSQPGDADYGLLYVTSGDGGNHVDYDRFAEAQVLDSIYGKILRINPDPTAHALVRVSKNSGLAAYSIPPTNPFNGDDAQETRTSSTVAEIFTYGHRSPYRLTPDRATGKMYLGEVGENAREEVNLIEPGKNYGWGHVEGTIDVPQMPGDGTLVPGLTPPIFDLPRSEAHSITGGFVYRGSAIPALQGKYVFADLGQGFATAALFYSIVEPNDPLGPVGSVFEFQLGPGTPTFGGALLPVRIFSIGEDEHGELFFSAGPDPRNPPTGAPAYIVKLLPVSAFNGVVGDVNQDGVVDGEADVAAFVAGWKTSGHIGPYAQYTHGDLNFDGNTNLTDVHIFRGALATAGVNFSLAALNLEVPEPSTAFLAVVGCAAALAFGARSRVSRRGCRH